MSNVHTNRILQELRGKGLIDLRGKKLTILDWDRLREMAQFNPDYLHINQKIERDDCCSSPVGRFDCDASAA